MRTIIIILILIISQNFLIFAQDDTISFTLNLQEYEIEAKNILDKKWKEEKNNTDHPFYNALMPNRFSYKDLSTVSIPVINFTKNIRNYECGKNIEYYYNFSNNPFFQYVYFTNNKK